MAGAITGAAGQPALQPSAEQVALQSNYITDFNFLNQYLLIKFFFLGLHM